MTLIAPFTLAPGTGEPFPLYLHHFAAHLNATTVSLARRLDLPATIHYGIDYQAADPHKIAAATGLDHQAVTAILGHRAPHWTLLRIWAPQPSSRFCPSCLREGTGMLPAWSRATEFWCPTHRAALAAACSTCGTRPYAVTPFTAPASARACPHDLADSPHPPCPDPAAAHTAQQHISTLTTTLRERTTGAEQRRAALDTLTDLTVIAFHLHFAPQSPSQHRPHPSMLNTQTLTGAYSLYTAPRPGTATDPLAALAAAPDQRQTAVPSTWRRASPALTARIARSRDRHLTPLDRLRHATTLPTAVTDLFDTDRAAARARRIPDQLWPAWTIRLCDQDGVNNPYFRASTAVALLLPGSTLTLAPAAALLSPGINHATIPFHLRRLAAMPHGTTALQILTELALALDEHPIEIDYARRRALAAQTPLLEARAWKTIAARAGIRPGSERKLSHARRYLYELLTGGNLVTADEPYFLPEGHERIGYYRFVADLPTLAHNVLEHHAHTVLEAAGITGEPLTFSPPATWVTATRFPGADPDHTDPRAVLAAAHQHRDGEQRLNFQNAADALGISTEHVRYVLRHHPEDQPRALRHQSGHITAITDPEITTSFTTIAHPDMPGRNIYLVNLAWLHEQYTHWHRTLLDIAREIGCRKATLRQFAENTGIPLRPRSGGTGYVRTGAIPGHPSELPELLRTAMHGHNGHERIRRFLILTEHRTLTSAAQAIGTPQNALTTQLKALEHACGGRLFHRYKHPTPLGPLTELGEQLCEQARTHLPQHRTRTSMRKQNTDAQENDKPPAIRTPPHASESTSSPARKRAKDRQIRRIPTPAA